MNLLEITNPQKALNTKVYNWKLAQGHSGVSHYFAVMDDLSVDVEGTVVLQDRTWS